MNTEAKNAVNIQVNPKRMLSIAAIIVITVAFSLRFIPDDPKDFGPLSLVPAVFLIIYIFWTKRILEALTLASLMGFIMVEKIGFFTAFTDALLNVMMSEDIAWLFIVCGLMGSIIALIEKTGGAFAFGEWVSTKAKSRESTLIWTWVLGLAMFLDDYLNALTLGSCMAPATDHYRVSREFLSYVVDSTAAPVCVLVPITTWAVFASRLIEVNGLAEAGQGMKFFIQTIPFNFYAWAATIIVPLVILGVIPLIGPMKKAEKRSRETGVLAPPGSEKIDIRAGETAQAPENAKIINFALPILFLIAAMIYFDVDMMKGVISTIAFMFFLYIPQGLMSAEEFTDLCMKGLKNMLLPLMLMVLAFTFAEANDAIHFTEYVITSAAPIMSPQLMPLIVFIVLGATEFITGTNWGMYIIALPIVIPLTASVGANPVLTVAAVLSAGVWGSHICFYSDATIITSAATGCDNFQHAWTQMPFGFIAAGISAVAFLIAGFIF